ncbi:hypothetical protein, partial [Dialister succinatiphilus]|uniref:hypothetical protein n=1 Tax=Dialister succinatiphilus TaxID=487173 RepID=UPI003F7E0349
RYENILSKIHLHKIFYTTTAELFLPSDYHPSKCLYSFKPQFLFSTLRHTKRTPSIQRRPRDSSYAFISFCKSSSSLSVWTFPFLFLLLFYNLKSIPKSPKASGQPSNLRKKQSTSFCLPIPIQEAGGGPEGGAISSQPQAGI